ncbi:hypothetical protein DRQ33_08630, partial [bacterium]
EFADQKHLSQIMNICESEELLLQCLPNLSGEDVEIIVGPPPISDLGLIVSSYSLGSGKGILGIVGPTRMNYQKLVQIVSFTAKKMSELWKS